jgi:PhzF family phenazine biosynthesis protein
MEIPLFQVDAFANAVFSGNPAAVCPLNEWLPDARMQAIAAENNLSETAFFVPDGEGYALRWFTPTLEIDLCGHATLASAFIVCTELEPARTCVRFGSQSGPLEVVRDGDLFELDFPSRPAQPCEPPPDLAGALGAQPAATLGARDLVAVFETEQQVRSLAPDFARIARIRDGLVSVTARGDEVDFVSRFFAPGAGIPEDPVTGSAHCTLIPYWSQRLGKTRLQARQVSARGGELLCEDRGERVGIAGRAVLYSRGSAFV